MKYLGIELPKPKVAVFGFTSCEGCQLQLANNEQNLKDLFALIEVVEFRLISSDKLDGYDIAFVEGSITTEEDVDALEAIRAQAKLLIAMGACACLGGVNNLRERFQLPDAVKEVYGKHKIESGEVRRVAEVVPVDIELPGCPISKAEFEWLVRQLILGIEPQFPRYSVCVECKQRINTCVMHLGTLCLGPITCAGCNAVCPRNRAGCWGCRGPSEEVNYESLAEILREHGFSEAHISERVSFFNAFAGNQVLPTLNEA
ncbi:MAG: NADH:ubiquinone oxidoreductase [Anaerolineales bacterium]|nr:NADH:ubiquinone oxidoreductase [Anaerolineales bacterium]